MKPLYSNILVKQDSAQEMTAGGLIIPDSNKDTPLSGKVVAVGEGYVNDDGSLRRLSVTVGDHIVFGKYAGSKVEINNEEFIVMDEADVYGIL